MSDKFELMSHESKQKHSERSRFAKDGSSRISVATRSSKHSVKRKQQHHQSGLKRTTAELGARTGGLSDSAERIQREIEESSQKKEWKGKGKNDDPVETMPSKIDSSVAQTALQLPGLASPSKKKANVFSRMKIDENIDVEPFFIAEMVKAKVQFSAMPEKIRQGINEADRMFGDYLKVNRH